MKGVAVVALWLVATSWAWRSQQGIYEDHKIMAAAQGAPPSLWQRRGLTRWSFWYQAQVTPAPIAMRAVNLALAGVVMALMGLLATRLGLSGWLAAAVVGLHPLSVESVAMFSGRADILATIGVLVACLGAMSRRGRWIVVPLALGLGWLGKEIAAVGLVLVPLVWRRRGLSAVGLIACLGGAWLWRHAGIAPSAPAQPMADWMLLQSAAAMRLLSQMVVPLGLTPDADIDALSRGVQIASAASLGALALLASRLWRRHTALAIGVCWMLAVIAPRLIVQTPRSYLNAHQCYLALPGLALMIAAGLTPRSSQHGEIIYGERIGAGT